MASNIRLNRSVAVQERAVAADGIETHDLAVNPLSVILLCLRPLAATTVPDSLAIYNALNRVSVLFRGESVFNMRGQDAAMLNYFRNGIVAPRPDFPAADNDRMCAVLPLLLGKFAYDPTSCFPASKRGELVLELDIDVADTGYDGFRYSVETIEILGASPKEFERKVSQSVTLAATGDSDIDLPVGNLLRGALCFGTTSFFGEAAPAPSWGRMQVLLDNQQHSVSSTDFEALHASSCLLGRSPMLEQTGASNAIITPPEVGNYGYLDFDPTRDDTFAIDTKGRSRCVVRTNAETADAVRVTSIERVSV